MQLVTRYEGLDNRPIMLNFGCQPFVHYIVRIFFCSSLSYLRIAYGFYSQTLAGMIKKHTIFRDVF